MAIKSFNPAQIQMIEALRSPSVIQGGPPLPDLDLLYSQQAPQAVEVGSPAEVAAIKVRSTSHSNSHNLNCMTMVAVLPIGYCSLPLPDACVSVYGTTQEVVKNHALAIEMQDYPSCVVRGEEVKSALGLWPEVRGSNLTGRGLSIRGVQPKAAVITPQNALFRLDAAPSTSAHPSPRWLCSHTHVPPLHTSILLGTR